MITVAVIIGLGLVAVTVLGGMYHAWQKLQPELENLAARDDGDIL